MKPSSVSPSIVSFPSNSPAVERHYSVAEVAKLWSISAQSVIRLFENDRSLIMGSPETLHKRGYRI